MARDPLDAVVSPWLVALADLGVCAFILAALIGARILYDRRNTK